MATPKKASGKKTTKKSAAKSKAKTSKSKASKSKAKTSKSKAKSSKAKPERGQFALANKLPLILELQIAAGKDKTGVFNNQEQRRPDGRKDGVERRTNCRQQEKDEQDQHPGHESGDLHQVIEQDMQTVSQEDAEAKRFIFFLTGQ